MLNKNSLRKHYSNLRSTCSKEQNDALIRNLLNSTEYKTAKTVFAYIPIKTEPDTYKIILNSIENKKAICVPKCYPDTHTMKFIEISSVENDLKPGSYKIPEPISEEEFTQPADLIIVPALSCDIHGNRLGYGGGFYDRFLKEQPYSVKAVMIYDCLLAEQLPIEPTDIPVDIIITESRIIRLK